MFSQISFVLFVIMCLLVFVEYKKYIELNTKIQEIKKKREEALLVDLELATTDQLFEELQKRPRQPYLVLRPQSQGVRIESYNVPPVATARILALAAFIMQENLAQQGIDFSPDNWDDENPFSEGTNA